VRSCCFWFQYADHMRTPSITSSRECAEACDYMPPVLQGLPDDDVAVFCCPAPSLGFSVDGVRSPTVGRLLPVSWGGSGGNTWVYCGALSRDNRKTTHKANVEKSIMQGPAGEPGEVKSIARAFKTTSKNPFVRIPVCYGECEGGG
jgi:hypothetical protein